MELMPKLNFIDLKQIMKEKQSSVCAGMIFFCILFMAFKVVIFTRFVVIALHTPSVLCWLDFFKLLHPTNMPS